MSDTDRRKYLVQASGILLLGCLALNIIGSLTASALPDNGFDIRKYLAAAFPDIAIMICATAIAAGTDTLGDCGFRPSSAPHFALAGFLQCAIYPTMLLISSALDLIPALADSADAGSGLAVTDPAAAYLLTALLPALSEEFACRGVIYGACRGRGFRSALIVSSISFAVMHCDIRQSAYTLIFGFAMGVARELSGSVWPCVGAHFLLNAIGVTSDIIEADTAFACSRHIFGPIPDLAVLSAIGLIAAALIITSMRRRQEHYCDLTDPSAAAISVFHIAAWAMCLLIMAASIIFKT